ncbi:MAG: FkbM family methyltransferase [Candidatus Thorarchaeota archaeon]
MDLGANIGYVTLNLANIVGDSGMVYAVEPDKQNYDVLRRNIAFNGWNNRVRTWRIAISEENGITKFYTSQKSNLGSLHPTLNTNGDAISVASRSLDSFLKNRDLPVFYKMDVEGAEVQILNGMHNVAKRSSIGTKILIEVHPREYSDALNMRSALTSFVELRYRFRYVISAGLARPKVFRQKGYTPVKVFNCGSVWKRGLYEDVKTEDAIEFCGSINSEYIPEINKTTGKSVRAIMLEKMR